MPLRILLGWYRFVCANDLAVGTMRCEWRLVQQRRLMIRGAGGERGMDWKELTASFHVTSVEGLLSLARMERHQDVRARLRWLEAGEPPLGMLFVSHRWASPEHPDPGGELMRSVQAFLRLLLAAVEALLAPREERLRLLPSISGEGALQAEEIARRLLGFGPLSGPAASPAGPEARKIIAARYRSGERGPAFRAWIAQRIGAWLDYVCMPQRPLSREDEPEFVRTLQSLDRLAESAILVAMRRAGDDYSVRGWCLLEAFAGAGRSFARGVTLDIGRMERGEEAAVPAPPPAAPDAFAAGVMREAYGQDLAAFRDACRRWTGEPIAFADHVPPDAWSAYRSLQGSAFADAASDPNPFRPALDMVRELESALVERWLLSPAPHAVDLGDAVAALMARHRVRCADADQLVLGFTLACGGWIPALRPLFRDCLRLAYDASRAGVVAPAIGARLLPLPPAVRERLSAFRGPKYEAVRSSEALLQEHAPRYEMVTAAELNSIIK